MKRYKKPSSCSAVIPVVCMALVLASCGDSEPEITKGVYGKPAIYTGRAPIEYPDFSLHFIKKKPYESGSSDAPDTYLFEVTERAYSQQIRWQEYDYRLDSYELFVFLDKNYFLDLKRSDFLDKVLADGELILWTAQQFEQFEQAKRHTNTDSVHKLSASDAERNRLQISKEESRFLFEMYRGYLHVLDMANEDSNEDIARFLSEKDTLAQAKQVEYLLSRQNPNLDTLHLHDAVISAANARLSVSSSSANGNTLIGVQLIKQQGKWKIAEERIMPDNASGKAWIKHFMQVKKST